MLAGVGASAGASNSSHSREAVVVDLGEGCILFALLEGWNEFTARLTFFPLPRDPEPEQETAAVFGLVYALTSITLLIADAPMTKGRAEPVWG